MSYLQIHLFASSQEISEDWEMRKTINSMLIYSNTITEIDSCFYVRHFKLQNWKFKEDSSYKFTREIGKNASDS